MNQDDRDEMRTHCRRYHRCRCWCCCCRVLLFLLHTCLDFVPSFTSSQFSHFLLWFWQARVLFLALNIISIQSKKYTHKRFPVRFDFSFRSRWNCSWLCGIVCCWITPAVVGQRNLAKRKLNVQQSATMVLLDEKLFLLNEQEQVNKWKTRVNEHKVYIACSRQRKTSEPKTQRTFSIFHVLKKSGVKIYQLPVYQMHYTRSHTLI